MKAKKKLEKKRLNGGITGSLYTGDERRVGVGIFPGCSDSSEPRSFELANPVVEQTMTIHGCDSSLEEILA